MHVWCGMCLALSRHLTFFRVTGCVIGVGMASPRGPQDFSALHHLARAGGHHATEDLAASLLEETLPILRRQLPSVSEDILTDGVVDAILKLLASLECWNPQLASLRTFVVRCAYRRVLDGLRAEKRRRRAEHVAAQSRTLTSCEADSWLQPPKSSLRELAALIPDTAERNFLRAWLTGERGTASFAAILGIADRPVAEQRRQVKRTMERLRNRLRRRAGTIHRSL